ncbi:hypothetical protein CCLMGIMDO_CCLMGIMDO_01450 [Companilactobacillus crustorum]|uniref:hypothetical protein n=1 Tax=Companilactobacillus crustorum TaxID=392416 RepID=UPI000A4DABF9
MKYLITGATGHLGSHIFNDLIKLVPSSDITAGVHTISKAKSIADTGAQVVGIDFMKEVDCKINPNAVRTKKISFL